MDCQEKIAMNIEQALTQEIIAHPDDDLPRLAFADWLEEQGEAEHAELVRVQIELARLAEEDERRPALLARQVWLLARHTKEWGRPMRGLARRWEFRRGFVEGVTLPAERFPARAEKLFARAPLRHLHLAGLEDDEALAACSQMSQIRELTLSTALFSYPTRRFQTLLGSPHLRRLRSLRLCRGELHNVDLQTIVSLPDLEQLELQGCYYARPRHSQLTLGGPGSLPRLRRLSLSGWIGPVAWQPILERLEALALQGQSLPLQNAMQHLVSLRRSTPLRKLVLADVLSLDVAALLASGVLADLHSLELSHCPLGPGDIASLVGAGGPRSLVHLDLGSNPLGHSDIAALTQSSRLDHLTHLGLARVTQQDRAAHLVRSLCAAALPRLAALDLSGNELTDAHVLDLAASSLTGRLYWLDLRHNQVGDDGVWTLLSADWPQIAWLDLRGNNLSSAANARLRMRFGYSVSY
jgi:uncharacterized protein (TIGR02996 family)